MSTNEIIGKAVRSKVCVSDAHAVSIATAVIEAIEKAGFVIVPREPTEAMIEAGDDVNVRRIGHRFRRRAIWQAMIDKALSKD